jgi:hypothetical protein
MSAIAMVVSVRRCVPVLTTVLVPPANWFEG